MNIKFEFKDRQNKVRVLLMSAVTLAGIIMSLIVFPELLWVYVVFGAGAVFTFDFKFKYVFVLDIIFPVLASLTTLYIDHLISMVGKTYFDDVKSIILYLKDHGFMKIELEIVFVMSLYWILRVCCVPQKVAAFISPIPLLFLSTVNYYVYEFRGSILVPLDIYAAETAANVVTNYSFPILIPLTVAVFPFILMSVTFLHFKVSAKEGKWYVREVMCTFLAGFTIFFGWSFFTKVMVIMPGYSFNYMGTIVNGYISNFAILLRDSRVNLPSTYEDYHDRLSELSTDPDQVPDQRPHILVIMNESYCIPDMYAGEFTDYYDPDPFLGTLDYGTAMSSVFGGMTPNSEFSFLTALPTAFLPEGTTPYSMYIDGDRYSLATYLEQMGYTTCAMHPFHPNGWNRDRVYPYLGFDAFLSLDDFNPGDNDLVRDYTSDRYAYDYAVDYLEALPDDTPGFIFLVTMQNHGGYDYDQRLDSHPLVHSADTGEIDYSASTYLALINESDLAFEHLIERLEQEDEQYVVLLFGDHQPSAGFDADLSVGGGGWQIPYVIWSNYPTDYVQSQEITSINYMSLDLLDAADLPMSDYYRYIESIRSEIPSINSVGFMYEGQWHPISDANGLRPMDAYRSLQYYYLFES